MKAAETRYMAPFVAMLANSFLIAPPGHPDAAVLSSVRKLCNALAEVYDVLYAAGRCLTDDEKKHVQRLLDTFSKHMHGVRSHFHAAGLLLYKICPKCHYVLHMGDQSLLINPVSVQCYADESLVGVICGIWHKSISGHQVKTVQLQALTKWLTLVILEMDL